jgi:hypothetical protein
VPAWSGRDRAGEGVGGLSGAAWMAEWRDHRPASSAGREGLPVRAQKGPGEGNGDREAVEWESGGHRSRRQGPSPSPGKTQRQTEL